MKKTIKPIYLVLFGVLGYIIRFTVGGIIGDAIGLLGFILLALGIVGLISSAVKHNKKAE